MWFGESEAGSGAYRAGFDHLRGRGLLDRRGPGPLGVRGFRTLGGRVVGGLGRAAAVLVGATVLLHVVLAGEGFVALRAESVLFASVLLGVAGSVARGGEVVGAVELLGERARVLVLLARRLGGRLGARLAAGALRTGVDGTLGARAGISEGWRRVGVRRDRRIHRC